MIGLSMEPKVLIRVWERQAAECWLQWVRTRIGSQMTLIECGPGRPQTILATWVGVDVLYDEIGGNRDSFTCV